jgi:hypothetical protein
VFAARYLPPASPGLVRALRRRGREVWPLRRRGADLGHAVPLPFAPPTPAVAQQRWRAAEPVFLPGMLGAAPQRHAAAIAASLRMFDRLRRGGSLLTELERRLRHVPALRYAGSSEGGPDDREIERVFVDAWSGDTRVAQDLWAMLAWLATDRSDRSLRIRFSNGADGMEQWLSASNLTAGWVDLLAAHAFPECAAVLGCQPLRQLLQDLLGRPYRLSERILYNNTPDGGAVFHHDAEPGQLGVIFSQLEGTTGWLTLSKRRLAAVLVKTGHARNQVAAMQSLDDPSEELWRTLNRDAEFTAELAARGALFVLHAGDCIALPSHSTEEVAWHSVLGLGRRPSLAHSYGIFPRAKDYPAIADRPLPPAAPRARQQESA